MIVKIKFPKNFKVQVYKEFQKSKRINGLYEIHSGIIYVDRGDVEQSVKIFERLVLNYKIV
jgi:hypothetical protein